MSDGIHPKHGGRTALDFATRNIKKGFLCNYLGDDDFYLTSLILGLLLYLLSV